MTTSIIQNLGKAALPLMFPILLLKRWVSSKAMIAILVGVFLTGCFQHFYRTNTRHQIDAATLQSLRNAGKYFILHTKDSILALHNIELQDNVMQADLAPLALNHTRYLKAKTDKANLVRKKDKPFNLVEVHLYASNMDAHGQSHISIPLSDVNRIDVYEFDKKSTTTNHILSWVGAGLFSATVITLIAFAIACNCPQVSTCQDGQCEFKSGVYSGAIYAGLERTDYLPLDQPADGQDDYEFQINNVADEVQFINHLSLMQVGHPDGTSVLADRGGRLFGYSRPIHPIAATDNNQIEVGELLRSTDRNFFSFDSETREGNTSFVNLTFEKPAGVKTAKLIVHAGNSRWSGYAFHQFISLFGNRFEAWRTSREKTTIPNPDQWQLEQSLPLKVYVETRDGWKYTDYFPATGNTASRDMIMGLDLSGITSNKVNIRIETAFRFWDLDQVMMDFTPEPELTVTYLSPDRAEKSDGTNEQSMVKSADSSYCRLENNQYLNVSFKLPGKPDQQLGYFLVSSGYYHTSSHSQKPADLEALESFRHPGAFDRFSRIEFARLDRIARGEETMTSNQKKRN